MTRFEEAAYLGELHVRHAVLDIERARLSAELKELEKRIDAVTRSLLCRSDEKPPTFDLSDVPEHVAAPCTPIPR